MRITLVTQFYDPEPAWLQSDLARLLAERGHDVTVVTGYPNYPGGRVYAGYRIGWRRSEIVDGVRIVRLPLYPSHDASAGRRFINYASFALALLVLGLADIRRSDVVYCYHPPGTVSFVTTLLCRVMRRPSLVHIQDIWPDSVVHAGLVRSRVITAAISWLLERTAAATYRFASRMVVISPGFRSLLIDRGADPARLAVVYNWANEAHQQPAPRDPAIAEKLGVTGCFVVVYAGNMGPYQGLDVAIRAAKSVEDLVDFRVVMIGNGSERAKLVELAAANSVGNVQFLERVPPSEIGSILNVADAHLVSLIDLPFFASTIPGKTQAAMSSGRPLVMAVRGDAASLVREAGAGITCEPQNVGALEQAFREAYELRGEPLENMGAAGHRYYQDRLAFEHAGERLSRSLEELGGTGR